jgi:hypothetical protein
MKTAQELFEKKYIPEPMSGCFLWMGAQHRQGYGSVGKKGKSFLAHRVSWELYRGKIPNGLCVLHSCDNPPCVNPGHLFLGTYSDNNYDCGKKGRSNKKGSINGNASLTEADVKIIRSAPRKKRLLYELAEQFGTSRANIAQIRAGRNWKGI